MDCVTAAKEANSWRSMNDFLLVARDSNQQEMMDKTGMIRRPHYVGQARAGESMWAVVGELP